MHTYVHYIEYILRTYILHTYVHYIEYILRTYILHTYMHVWLITLWLKLQSPCQSSSYPVRPHERYRHVCTRQGGITFESEEFSWGCVPQQWFHAHMAIRTQWTLLLLLCRKHNHFLIHRPHLPSHPHKKRECHQYKEWHQMYVHEYKSN